MYCYIFQGKEDAIHLFNLFKTFWDQGTGREMTFSLPRSIWSPQQELTLITFLEALSFCCLERLLSKAKGQELHWFLSHSIWIGSLYLTKQVYCQISLYSNPSTLNSMWFPWPRTTKACKSCLQAHGDEAKVTHSFPHTGQLAFLYSLDQRSPHGWVSTMGKALW